MTQSLGQHVKRNALTSDIKPTASSSVCAWEYVGKLFLAGRKILINAYNTRIVSALCLNRISKRASRIAASTMVICVSMLHASIIGLTIQFSGTMFMENIWRIAIDMFSVLNSRFDSLILSMNVCKTAFSIDNDAVLMLNDVDSSCRSPS